MYTNVHTYVFANVCAAVCAYMHVPTRVRACEGAHVRGCVWVNVCMCVRLWARACRRLRVWAHVRARVCAWARVRVRMCLCVRERVRTRVCACKGAHV